MRNAAGQVVGGWNFDRVATGAGGWVTSLDIADDGVMVARTDTYNSYVRGPSDTEWKPLLEAGKSIPESQVEYNYHAPGEDYGTASYDCCISASNSNRIYVAHFGRVFRSDDRGATFTRTAMPQIADLHPTRWRIGGRKMAVDPANPDVVGLGAYANGLIYTLDGGATWTTHPDIPATLTTPTNMQKMLIAFDRSSTVVGGRTQRVVVFSGGNGVYLSTTGINGQFTLIAGSPIIAKEMHAVGGVIHTLGTLNGDNEQYRRFASGAWTAPAGISGASLAIRPTNTNMIQMFNAGGSRIAFSTDGGVTWTSHQRNGGRTATDIPWLEWTLETWMSNGATIYHPTLDRLYFSEGIGVWYTDNLPYTASGGLVPWISMSKGIEQLCTQEITVNPNGKVMITNHDRAFFTLERDSITTYPSTHGSQNTVNPISHGMSIDYAIDDPNFLVGGETGAYKWSYSTNGGSTWTPFPALPDLLGGNVAVSNKNNIVIVPSNNRRPRYTLDGGNTWNDVVINPLYDATQGWHASFFLRRICVVADKQVPGTFYLFCRGGGGDTPQDVAMRGLWRSTDGGVNWTRVYNTYLTGNFGYDYWNGKLKMVPGCSPHMMWTCGGVGFYGDAPSPVGLRFSSDGGASWATVPGMLEPQDFCWTAGRPGEYPMLWAYGWVNGEIGLYRMDDFNPANASGTWQFVTKWPYGTFDILVLGGDAGKFGRMYMGLYSGGQLFAEYADKARAT